MGITKMEFFYIFSDLKSYELYDLIDFKNSKIEWEQDSYNLWRQHQTIKTETIIPENFYNHFVCVSFNYSTKEMKIYCEPFEKYLNFSFEEGYNFLSKHNLNKVNNYILKEEFTSLEYTIQSIEKFCKVVAHNKAEQYLLEGNS